MAGLCRGECRGHRLRVAHLTDQDHVRVLPECALERGLESLRVEPDVALGHHASLVVVADLYRVLDGQDVTVTGLVDVVDHRGERRGLPRSDPTGHEDQAARLLGEEPDDRGKTELFDVANLEPDVAQHEADRSLLANAFTRKRPTPGISYAKSASLVAANSRAWCLGHHLDGECLDRFGRERGVVGAHQATVDSERRRSVGLQVNVGSVAIDCIPEQRGQVHTDISGGEPGQLNSTLATTCRSERPLQGARRPRPTGRPPGNRKKTRAGPQRLCQLRPRAPLYRGPGSPVSAHPRAGVQPGPPPVPAGENHAQCDLGHTARQEFPGLSSF